MDVLKVAAGFSMRLGRNLKVAATPLNAYMKKWSIIAICENQYYNSKA